MYTFIVMKQKIIIAAAVLLGALAVGGLSYYFAQSGGGQIDVNHKITTTDQQGFEREVLPDTRAVVPNGGLRPQGAAPVVEPPAPEPIPTEEATTTEEAASSTESAAESSEETASE